MIKIFLQFDHFQQKFKSFNNFLYDFFLKKNKNKIPLPVIVFSDTSSALLLSERHQLALAKPISLGPHLTKTPKIQGPIHWEGDDGLFSNSSGRLRVCLWNCFPVLTQKEISTEHKIPASNVNKILSIFVMSKPGLIWASCRVVGHTLRKNRF